jgi:hypothetical protein
MSLQSKITQTERIPVPKKVKSSPPFSQTQSRLVKVRAKNPASSTKSTEPTVIENVKFAPDDQIAPLPESENSPAASSSTV